MKRIPKRKVLTLGEMIVSVYDVCGKDRAIGIIRLAMNSHVLHFTNDISSFRKRSVRIQ